MQHPGAVFWTQWRQSQVDSRDQAVSRSEKTNAVNIGHQIKSKHYITFWLLHFEWRVLFYFDQLPARWQRSREVRIKDLKKGRAVDASSPHLTASLLQIRVEGRQLITQFINCLFVTANLQARKGGRFALAFANQPMQQISFANTPDEFRRDSVVLWNSPGINGNATWLTAFFSVLWNWTHDVNMCWTYLVGLVSELLLARGQRGLGSCETAVQLCHLGKERASNVTAATATDFQNVHPN